MDTLVYTAHSHLTISRSVDIVLFVLSMGYIPIDPFLTLPHEVYDQLKLKEEDCWNVDTHLLKHCDGLWIFGDITPGVSGEIAWWKKNRTKEVKYFVWDVIPKMGEYDEKRVKQTVKVLKKRGLL